MCSYLLGGNIAGLSVISGMYMYNCEDIMTFTLGGMDRTKLMCSYLLGGNIAGLSVISGK